MKRDSSLFLNVLQTKDLRGLLADGTVPGRKRGAQIREDANCGILYALTIR